MNPKWLGDDHDIRKYCLLYFLSGILNDCNILINWMPTEDEKIDVPKKYEKLVNALRNFKTFEDMDNLLTDNELSHISCPNKEGKNWQEILNNEKNLLVFFDPDTGIATQDNQKEELKYLSYQDLFETYKNDNVIGIIIYQHALRAPAPQKGGKNEDTKSVAQRKNIGEKIKSLKTKAQQYGIQLPDPLIFLGNNKKNKKNEFCFEEAYIILIKKEFNSLINTIKSNMDFNEEFLEIKETTYFLPTDASCLTPSKTN